jgi:hypothetical protein
MMNNFANSIIKKNDEIFKNLNNELKIDKQLDSEIKTMDLKLRCIKTGKVINFEELNRNLNK